MLTQEMISEIISKIAAKINPKRIILFGSYADGTATPDSDLDIFIEKESDLPRFKRAREIHRLFNPYPWSMDIVVYTPEEIEKWKDTPNSLVATVLREGKIIYAG